MYMDCDYKGVPVDAPQLKVDPFVYLHEVRSSPVTSMKVDMTAR